MKKGFTLIEALIALAVFMVTVSIAVGGFVTALHTQNQVATLISAQSNVSLAMEQMAREIRTGFLFCHANSSTSTDPLPTCEPCYLPGDGSLICSGLDFFNANNDEVVYSVSTSTGALMEKVGQSGDPQPLTSGDIKVTNLAFRLWGNLEDDHWPPRITVFLTISPNSTDPGIASTTLNFETTVSARQLDCDVNTHYC